MVACAIKVRKITGILSFLFVSYTRAEIEGPEYLKKLVGQGGESIIRGHIPHIVNKFKHIAEAMIKSKNSMAFVPLILKASTGGKRPNNGD